MDPARHARAVEKIARLSGQSGDLVSLWRESTAVIAGEIPYFWTPCWFTLDPASLLITSHFHEGLAEFPDDWLADEYYGEDLHRLSEVASSSIGISTLHEATGGDPSGTRRWQQNMEMGGDQELIAGLRTRSGEVWGALGLYREPDRPIFDAAEKRFVMAITTHLADGARRALMVGEATDPEGPNAPGLIVLNEQWEIESSTPGVDEWLADFPDANQTAGQLPAAVQAVAGQAMRSFQHPDQRNEIAVSRVLSRSGTWMVLHGAPLLTGTERRVAIIVEPAHPALIYPLLMSAYGFTERERDVTRLVLEGHSTQQIAESLFVSTNTVQQHLKSIFDKTGVRSRRDLVGKIFYTHYEPRFRDNEKRVDAGKPLRGGPSR